MQIVEPIRTLDNIEKIKKVLKSKKDRNFLLFILGINCGLRVSDLLQLKISDIKNKTHIELVEQKTGKIRRFPLNPILTKLLNDYIKNKDENQWLFKSQKGVNQPITRIQAYRIIKKACERAGIQNDISSFHAGAETHIYCHNKNANGETFMPVLLGLADVYNMHSAAEKVDYKSLIKGYQVIKNTFEEFNKD